MWTYSSKCPKCGKPYIYVGDVPLGGWIPGSEPYCTCGQKETYSSPSYGWVCPKCGRVYAPWVSSCETCIPNTITSSSSTFKYDIGFGGDNTYGEEDDDEED